MTSIGEHVILTKFAFLLQVDARATGPASKCATSNWYRIPVC
eukprot:CAMPEP_0114040276 /NCGR_PEP_ID=MMETSP1339-20121228/3907_1 /TAXON_ID=94617 /ORGANISM="Fibrocapsa japonica" /LENGTH=41 /assembly_acc=CAM_ASM_000762